MEGHTYFRETFFTRCMHLIRCNNVVEVCVQPTRIQSQPCIAWLMILVPIYDGLAPVVATEGKKRDLWSSQMLLSKKHSTFLRIIAITSQ